MKRILLLLAVTAVMVLAFASVALASNHPTGGATQPLPTTGGPALLPLVGILAVSLGLSGLAYLRRKR